MALIAQRNIGFVPVVALRAFDVAAFGDVVFVRIPFKIFRSLCNGLERFVAFEARLSGGRRLWLRLCMARIACEAPLLVAVRCKAALFLDGDRSG
jgi:hypothetical protein